jgi:RNA polymerase sigma-70 factor, ECF subfamily
VSGTPTVSSVPEARDYERVFQESAPALWRALYGFTGGRRQIAEDALAEAFARAMERGDRVRDPLAYIYRTAFRLASAELQRDKRSGALESERAAVEPPDLVDVMRALDTLPERQRAAVILHDVEGYSVSEVGHLIGIATPTVRVHLHRGRKKLQALLGSEEDDYDD